MPLDGETLVFHTRDGRRRELLVPRQVWDEQDFWRDYQARYDRWLDHAIGSLAAEGEEFDVYAIAKDAQAEINAARPAWEAKRERIALAGELATRLGIDAGESMRDLRDRPSPDVDWFVHGLIAPGTVTVLAGREKGGKSYLMNYLLGKLERAEGTCFGPAFPAPVTAVVLTEEPEAPLRQKLDRFGLELGWIVEDHKWPLDRFDPADPWAGKVALAERLALDLGAGVVVFDPLARLAGIEDEAGRELGQRMETVCAMAHRSGLAAVVVHHANKKGRDVSEMDQVRGSTSLSAAADTILVVGQRSESAQKKYPNQRLLTARGRMEESNFDERTVEFDPATSEYEEVDVSAEVAAKKEQAARERQTAESMLMMQSFRACVSPVTATTFMAHTGVARLGTAAAKLRRLEEEGKLTSRKVGRETVYTERKDVTT